MSRKTLYPALKNHLSERNINPDNDQETILHALGDFMLEKYPLFGKPKYSGIYIWGPPGRGKSMLMATCMDCFEGKKIRIHFHDFFKSIHSRLTGANGNAENLSKVLKEWFAPYKLVCFDEFHVHDIANAQLIGNFLKIASENKCKIILTSNYQPDGLFPDPTYHHIFEPYIDLIKHRFKVLPLITHEDYRMIKALPTSTRFFHPDMNASVVRFLSERDSGLQEQDDVIELSGRYFNTFMQGKHTVGFDFNELCAAETSYTDYIEMVEKFDTVFLKNIDRKHFESRDTMMRFIWFMDVIYDKNISLYMTSYQPVIETAKQYMSVNDADRFISRLSELSGAVSKTH